jgi:hypothetical protein
MAVHYPADYNVFALVHIEDKNTIPNDKGFIKSVENKINREFTGTAEDIRTLKVVLELEQIIGKNIDWVVGDTFDAVIRKHKAIPNKMWRFCTTDMKMKPIFEWWLQNIGEIVKMGIGFRLDEFERAEKFTETMKYKRSQSLTGQKRHKWDEIKWREGWFPLIDDGITHKPVNDYWKGKLEFPNSSNCQMCFWKKPQELRQNFEENPNQMNWALNKEKEMNNTFRTDLSMEEASKIGLQQSMFWGGGSCQSEGYCTD